MTGPGVQELAMPRFAAAGQHWVGMRHVPLARVLPALSHESNSLPSWLQRGLLRESLHGRVLVESGGGAPPVPT